VTYFCDVINNARPVKVAIGYVSHAVNGVSASSGISWH